MSYLGATAFVPALVNSGFPVTEFVFEGFLPPKKGRQTRLNLLAEEKRTLIFYESPHKLLKTLGQFSEYFGEERIISVSRELTKSLRKPYAGQSKKSWNTILSILPKEKLYWFSKVLLLSNFSPTGKTDQL